jgi:hypothetical protein
LVSFEEVATPAGQFEWSNGVLILRYANPILQAPQRASVLIKAPAGQVVILAKSHGGGIFGRDWIETEQIRIDPGKTGSFDTEVDKKDIILHDFSTETVANAPDAPKAPNPTQVALQHSLAKVSGYIGWIIALIVIIVIIYIIIQILRGQPFFGIGGVA